MKRLCATGLAIASLLAACSRNVSGEAGIGDCAHRIAYLSSGDALNDDGVREAGWEGVTAGARALGLGEPCATFAMVADAADVLPEAGLFVAQGYDIVVTAGFALRDVTREAARRYPGVAFIGVEQRQTGDGEPSEAIANLAGLVFHEDVEGFLAGALAGLVTQSDVVGGVFGCEIIPPTIRYRVGFRNGAEHVNLGVEVRIATHPGTPDVCFSDPAYGAELARGLLDEGADVVFAEGYETGEGAALAACEQGAVVIGSGFDRLAGLAGGPECVVSTVSRDVESGVRALIVAVDAGDFHGGDVFGEVRLTAYRQGGAGVRRDVNARLETLAGALAKGEIDPCAPPNEGAMCTPIGH